MLIHLLLCQNRRAGCWSRSRRWGPWGGDGEAEGNVWGNLREIGIEGANWVLLGNMGRADWGVVWRDFC